MDETEAILEELWLKNKKINRVKGINNDIWYERDPMGVATILSPRMTPNNIPVGTPMLVVIGHSEVRDYQDMSIFAIREQRDLFQKAGYRIKGPWGDFAANEDFLRRGLRLFHDVREQLVGSMNAGDPDYRGVILKLVHEMAAVKKIESIENLKAHEKYGAYYDILKPLLKAEFKKLVADVKAEAKKNSVEPDVIDAMEKTYPKFFKQEFKGKDTQFVVDEIIEEILSNLDEVKRRVIKEVSTVYDINYQVQVLLMGVPIKAVLYQFINSYEPVEAIRGAALPKEVAKFRLEKMIPVFLKLGIPDNISNEKLIKTAEVLGCQETGDKMLTLVKLREVYREKLKTTYGGGATADNAGDMVEAGYNGAFVARHIYDVNNAVGLAKRAGEIKEGLDLFFNFKAAEKGPWMPWLEGYAVEGVDFEKVNIFHCVSVLHVGAAMAELRGDRDAAELFRDAREDKPRNPITIDARGERSIATKGTGSNSGILPAEFLASAGVTRAIVGRIDALDSSKTSYILTQMKNLMKAGIAPVVIYSETGFQNRFPDNWIKRYRNAVAEEIGEEAAKKIEFQSEEIYPITPINQIIAVHAEMAGNLSEPRDEVVLHAREKGYYEKVGEPEGVDQEITETIKAGKPVYLWENDECQYFSGTEQALGIITLGRLREALKYVPNELLGEKSVKENGIALPEIRLQEGIGVRKITIRAKGKLFQLGEAPDFKNPGFHILACVKGVVRVYVQDVDNRWRNGVIKAEDGWKMFVIPDSAKQVTITAETDNTETMDMFMPMPEKKLSIDKPFEQSRTIIMPQTGIRVREVKGIIKVYQGRVSETVDVLTLNGKKTSPPSMITYGELQKPHRILVKSGAVKIDGLRNDFLLNENNTIVVFGPGEVLDVCSEEGFLKFTSPDGRKFHFAVTNGRRHITEYQFVRAKNSETVILEISYPKTTGEQAVYSVYEAVKSYVPLISQKKIDLIVPREMFAGMGKASRIHAQKILDGCFGKDVVRIKGYSSEAGLDNQSMINLLKSSLSRQNLDEARIPVLFVTESNIVIANQKVEQLLSRADGLEELLQGTRILSLPDLTGLDDKGWLYAHTVLRIGLLQACLTVEDIQLAGKGEKTLAQDVQKMMKVVACRPEISIQELYLMLSYKECPSTLKKKLQIANAIVFMKNVLQRLMLGIPMVKIDRSDWKDRMGAINASL
ncbi:MAG: hypothetical protein ABH844_01820 [Candidatus Omnitrophota bacterium]